MGASHRTRTHPPGPPAAGRSGLPRRQYLCGGAAGWSSEGDLCDQPEDRAMSGTSIATNPYLQKLKTRDLSQPTKLTEPGTDLGFVGFVATRGAMFSKIQPRPSSGPCEMSSRSLSSCPDHVEPDRWQQAVEDGRTFLGRWGEQADALAWTAR